MDYGSGMEYGKQWGDYIYRTLVPQLGIKSMPPSVEAPCLNYQTTREFPQNIFLKVQNIRK